jgi:hypothetical protein
MEDILDGTGWFVKHFIHDTTIPINKAVIGKSSVL